MADSIRMTHPRAAFITIVLTHPFVQLYNLYRPVLFIGCQAVPEHVVALLGLHKSAVISVINPLTAWIQMRIPFNTTVVYIVCLLSIWCVISILNACRNEFVFRLKQWIQLLEGLCTEPQPAQLSWSSWWARADKQRNEPLDNLNHEIRVAGMKEERGETLTAFSAVIWQFLNAAQPWNAALFTLAWLC